MLNIARNRAVLASRASAAAPFSTAFRPSGAVREGDKKVDPTPDKARGGSEQSMPGASGDAIASSGGAYDGDKPRPEQSSEKIEDEKPVDMGKSAASSKPSENAEKAQQNRPSAGASTNPAPSGGSTVRRGNSH